MNINLHIERLVLDGLPVSDHQGGWVRAAVESELSRLLADHGLAATLSTGGSIPNVQASNVQLVPGSTPTQMGTQIAQSVYRGIGNPK
jgi:hypothetical protein